jgi:hypothetical protein
MWVSVGEADGAARGEEGLSGWRQRGNARQKEGEGRVRGTREAVEPREVGLPARADEVEGGRVAR